MNRASQLFPGRMQLSAHCPLCRAKYDPLEARVIETRDDRELVHVQCRRCRGAVVAVVSMSNIGATSIGVVTDCSSDDLVRLSESSVVTADDVLAMYTSVRRDRGRALLSAARTENTNHISTL